MRILRENGKRASPEAALALGKYLDNKLKSIVARAGKEADYSGRKTIIAEDIEKALQENKEEYNWET